jgi:hypothetical protein
MDEHRLDSRSTGVGVQVAVAMRELQISAGSREGAGSVEGGVVLHEVLANDRSIAADTGSGHASPSHVMDGASLFTGPRSLGRVGEEAGCDDVRLKGRECERESEKGDGRRERNLDATVECWSKRTEEGDAGDGGAVRGTNGKAILRDCRIADTVIALATIVACRPLSSSERTRGGGGVIHQQQRQPRSLGW